MRQPKYETLRATRDANTACVRFDHAPIALEVELDCILEER